MFDLDSRFRDLGKKCNGVDLQLPFSTCVGTLRISVNTNCIFMMILLLRYRVSISDGKTKIDTGNQCSPH